MDDIIMVGGDREYEWALQAGWKPKNIFRPKIESFEGLRWQRLQITWLALDKIKTNTRFLDILANHETLMNGDPEVVVCWVKPPKNQ